MAITILIVDDDKLLVDKLEETVNWSKIGIDMVLRQTISARRKNCWKNIQSKCFCVTSTCHRETGWNCSNGSDIKNWISNVPS